MEKNILVLTDFSKCSWDAMLYALQLYKAEHCNYYILNAYKCDAYPHSSRAVLDPEASLNEMSKGNSEEGLGEVVMRLTEMTGDTRNKYHALSKPYGVLEAVRKIQGEITVDAVVMGARGYSDEKGSPFGPTALEIMKSIRNCPVLVVPKNTQFQQPEEIVLATDFKAQPSDPQFAHLLDIARKTGAEICVLNLNDSERLSPWQEGNRDALRSRLNGLAHSFHILHHVDQPTAIDCFAESRNSNLISIIQPRRNFWQRMGIGKSLLGRMRNSSEIPLVAMHGSL